MIEAELVDDDEPLPPRISVPPVDVRERVEAGPTRGDAGPAREGREGREARTSDAGARAERASARRAAGAERRRFLAWVAGGGALLAGAATGAVLWGDTGGSEDKVRTSPVAAPPPAPPAAAAALRGWFQSDSFDTQQLTDLTTELRSRRGRTDFLLEARSRADIGQSLVAALNGPQAPDVFEVDLLNLASHHAAGRIADLTPHQSRFDGESWLPALHSAVKVGDQVVGLPLTVSVPVVLFHQGMYAAAGVTVPRTREEWVDGLEQLRRRFGSNPAFRSLHLPGRSWPVLASFMWEAGGALALREGESWRGAFDLPGSAEAVRFFRQLQQYAPEARDLTEGDLKVGELFARGETASVIGSAPLHAAATAVDPQLAQQLNAFAMPAQTPNRPGTVGVRGTALVVSSKCRDIPAAVELLALVASDSWRTRLTRTGGLLSPRAVPEQVVAGPNPMLRAGAAAARVSGRAYPVAPGWSERPLMDFGRAVLGGTDAMAAAVAANQTVAAEFGRTTG